MVKKKAFFESPEVCKTAEQAMILGDVKQFVMLHPQNTVLANG